MRAANDPQQYGLVSKAFHWSVAVLILGLLPVGFVMAAMEYSPLKLEVYGLHKSFGLLVFFLGLLRIVWRFYAPRPSHLSTHAKWEMVLATAAHFWLYVCMIGMPLTGWLMSSAGEFPVPFFGLQLPYLIGKDPDLMRFFGDAHEILAFTLLFILALHMAGALKHHVMDKDATLRRMAGGGQGLAVPALIILIAGASYGISALALYKDLTAQKQAAPAVVQHQAASPSETHAANGWAIAHDKSTLGFGVTLYGAKVQGAFKSYDGDIVFDPADLAGAKAEINIDMASVDTGDTGRDDTIRGEAWFDVQNHPSARFITNSFESLPDGGYVAYGDLTLRGKTLPVYLPFTLEIADKTAHMLGKLTLNRLDFDIGAGSWADEKTVGHTVEISIDLTAKR